jgi:hypothetical protein
MDLLLAYPLACFADAMLADLLTRPAKPSITGSHAVTAQIAMPRAPKLAAVMHP